MKRFILHPWGLILVLAMTFVFAFLQEVADYVRKSVTVVTPNISCVVTDSWVPSGAWDNRNIHLALDCQGQKMQLENKAVIASYIRNPGPLTCTINKAGDPKCQLRK